jgi:hypothetical protein
MDNPGFMAAPLSFLMVKTGGFASPDFSGFAPYFMIHTVSNHGYQTKRIRLICTSGTNGLEIQTGGWNLRMNGCFRNMHSVEIWRGSGTARPTIACATVR